MQRIDNFLENDVFNNIKNIIIKNFPWYYNETTGSDNDFSDFLFFHLLFQDNQVKSSFFNSIMIPIISRLKMNNLIRAKINCYTNKNKSIETEMHTDSPDYHKVALFSINTNNGYTLFENGDKFESKENTLLLFDGHLKHCSVAQIDSNLRINININYI
jgi:hypothetical protein